MSSEHDVRVVRVGAVAKHENADALEITEVDGRPVIFRSGDYLPGDLAVYVPVDSVVPTSDPRFAFLGKGGPERIRAKRLRGVFSMGLLVAISPGMSEGDDVREAMGITVYEPDVSRGGRGPGGKFLSSGAEPDPGFLPVYDVESARKYRGVLVDGEEVVITEKVHGANARFAWKDGRLWCASRNQFKLEDPTDLWWEIAGRYDLARLAEFDGIAFYGEVYGQVQDLKYGADDHRLVLFDAYHIATRKWLDYATFLEYASRLGIPTTPELYRGPWQSERWEDYKSLAEGPTVLGGGACVREGWVLRPTLERWHPRLGRVQMKLHGEGYLTRKGG